VESARNELITKIIPKCIQSQEANENEDEEEHEQLSSIADDEGEDTITTNEQTNQTTIKDCLLSRYMEHPISISTTWRWLRRLGYRHDNRKKSFFVDGHERPDVVFYRNDFCTNYLSKLEPRTHRWT
jgi:hypothetical protein